MKKNKIYNMDALEFLKGVESDSVDLIVTDPPYLMCSTGGGGICGKRRNYNYLYDESRKESFRDGFSVEILDEFRRVQKVENLYIFCNVKLLPMLFDYYKNDKFDLLVYHKKNPIPAFRNKYLSDLEYIFFVCNDRTKLGGDFSSLSKLFSINIPKKEFDHPTIKPLDIVTTLIQNSSKEGELVLDCYMGSGTTAVAAKSVNRNFIGSEWNKKYCDIAEQRLMCVQGRLF